MIFDDDLCLPLCQNIQQPHKIRPECSVRRGHTRESDEGIKDIPCLSYACRVVLVHLAFVSLIDCLVVPVAIAGVWVHHGEVQYLGPCVTRQREEGIRLFVAVVVRWYQREMFVFYPLTCRRTSY